MASGRPETAESYFMTLHHSMADDPSLHHPMADYVVPHGAVSYQHGAGAVSYQHGVVAGAHGCPPGSIAQHGPAYLYTAGGDFRGRNVSAPDVAHEIAPPMEEMLQHTLSAPSPLLHFSSNMNNMLGSHPGTVPSIVRQGQDQHLLRQGQHQHFPPGAAPLPSSQDPRSSVPGDVPTARGYRYAGCKRFF